MTRRAVILAVIATIFAAGFLAGRATGHAPTTWTPVPSSAFRGYVVHPGTLSRSDAEPDPTHPRRVLTASSTPSLVARPRATATHVRQAPREGSPRRSGARGGVLSGLATWYATSGPGLYAAAGPALRKGDWRGRRVVVCSGGRCLRLALVDWCACGSRHGVPTLLDLSRDAFAALAPLSAGVVRVSVSW